MSALTPDIQLVPSFASALLPDEPPRNSVSAVLEASRPVLGNTGWLYGFTVYNSNAGAQFILLFDQKERPTAGQTGIPFRVSGTSSLLVAWTPLPRWMERGAWLANSSTEPTLTAGAADCFFDVQYAVGPVE